MNGMADDYYDVWLEMLGRTSRPSFRALLLSRAQNLRQLLREEEMQASRGVLSAPSAQE